MRGSGLALAAGVALLAATSSASADEARDPWFGPDKAIHFGVSFAVSSGGYALGVATLEHRWVGVALGTGLAVSLGAAKEAIDAAGLGTPSWKDFAWDVAGAVLGAGVSLAFDAALRGPY